MEIHWLRAQLTPFTLRFEEGWAGAALAERQQREIIGCVALRYYQR